MACLSNADEEIGGGTFEEFIYDWAALLLLWDWFVGVLTRQPERLEARLVPQPVSLLAQQLITHGCAALC